MTKSENEPCNKLVCILFGFPRSSSTQKHLRSPCGSIMFSLIP